MVRKWSLQQLDKILQREVEDTDITGKKKVNTGVNFLEKENIQ